MNDPSSSRAAATVPVDLTNCDREPIHLLGAIQPFGFLIAVSTPDWFVQRVSNNVAAWLKVAPADMLGRSLFNFVSAEAIHTLRNQLHIVNMTGTTARLFGVHIDESQHRFDMAVHMVDTLVVIECEPSVADSSVNASALVRGMMNRVQAMRDPHKLGVRNLRAVSKVATALAAIKERTPRFALLDVNLGLDTSFEVATRLVALGVPFAFMTGYGENAPFPPELAHVERVRKPFTQQSLAAILNGQR